MMARSPSSKKLFGSLGLPYTMCSFMMSRMVRGARRNSSSLFSLSDITAAYRSHISLPGLSKIPSSCAVSSVRAGILLNLSIDGFHDAGTPVAVVGAEGGKIVIAEEQDAGLVHVK